MASSHADAVNAWLASGPALSLKLRLGPTVAQRLRDVTPESVLTVAPLISGILSGDGKFDFLQLRDALLAAISEHPSLASNWSVDQCVAAVTAHVRLLVLPLRTILRLLLLFRIR